MHSIRTSFMLLVCFVVVTGIAFPLAVYVCAQALFPMQANGSLLKRSDGTIIGSSLIGQRFSQSSYFHPRPSVAGGGYDGSSSAGTNLGPTSSKLIQGIGDDPATADVNEAFSGLKALAESYRAQNRLPPDTALPADAITHSASGLDPDISPANAALQARRVAEARKISEAEVAKLIRQHTRPRFVGIFGEPRVNVLELNLALDSGKG
ncbi:MAG: K(+)-transporting ATPase subunit C [Bdellovibrionota bacterium]